MSDNKYYWLDFELESELSGDGQGKPGVYYLTICDPFGEELSVICHRTVNGKFPIDGELADSKRNDAQTIVDALNRK